MRVIEDPKINSILPFIKFDVDDLQTILNDQSSLYIIDNMMLTKMKRDFVSFPLLVKGLKQSKLIVLPDIILEEAARNLPNEQRFKDTYYELFEILSSEKEIYVAGLETIAAFLQRMVGKNESLSLLKNIIMEATRINQNIHNSIRQINIHSSSVIDEFSTAIFHNGKNAGERIITIFALAFIRMFYSPIYIFSEDVKGIYGAFKTFIGNERLLELIDLQDHSDLIEQYRFLSYETLIQVMYQESKIDRNRLMQVIENSGRNQSRVVLYSLDGFPCHTPIPNHQLATWIIEDRIKIQF
ncbi:hypothetical protein [Bacillus benzoevorans]|uniref:Uncharacterized protein n=1 Tax=Bacillus benzoevorans TaxID=1456 RepID=A0A7X0HW54_9BACI|nr:hypothetical protein [Bacillus benzoevorans]MBB6446735.1 hypothetical protein [Bacillus benzoevorans]